MPVMFAVLPVLGLAWLDNPWVDRVFLLAAVAFAILAHPKGYRKHRRCTPAVLAVSGIVGLLLALLIGEGAGESIHHYIFASCGTLVAVSHILNQRWCRSCHSCHH
jgi:hypothetical protein